MLTAVGLTALGLLVTGFPLWVVLLLSSVVGIYFFTPIPLDVVVTNLYGSLDKYVLIAVPGFIFAGEVMAKSGMSQRLVNWLYGLVGRVPGSLPVVTVATGEVFGAISGSSPATVAAIGKTLYPGLREKGYSEKFGLGLITAVGALSIVIPPSITLILYSAMTNESVGALFLGGVIPGILIGGAVIAYCVGYSYKHRLIEREKVGFREAVRRTLGAGWTIGAPLLIFGGIYGGFFTPTEVAGVLAVYTVFVTVVVERSLGWRDLVAVTRTSVELTAKIFLIVSASGLFSWILTVGNVPATLVGAVTSWDLPGWLILVLLNLVLLIAGMFIDPASAVLVLTPLLLPVAERIGVDPVHFGVVMAVNLAIGMFTPPFGLNLFVSSSIFNVPTSRVVAGVLPFIAMYLIGLIATTYIPAITLWLPALAAK